MNKFIHILAISVVLLFSQCSDKNNSSNAETAPETSTSLLNLTDAQIKQLGIKMTALETDTISTTLALTGNLMCPQTAQTMVTYPMSIQVDKLMVQPGQRVQKGQIIATVSDMGLIQIQEEYWNTKSELQWAESEWNRQQKLKQENATSEKSWLESKVKWEQIQAKSQAQLERLKLLGIGADSKMNIHASVAIPAPHAGQLTDLNVSPGQRIQPGDAICKILDLNKLWAEVSLFDNQNAMGILGNSVEIEDAAHNQRTGKVIQVDGQVSPIDHAIHAWIEVNKPLDSWKPGQPITVNIAAQALHAVKLPKTAMINFENKDYIFVMKSKNNFELTPIQKVHEDQGFVWIEGQFSGAQIITDGAYYALQAMKNQGE